MKTVIEMAREANRYADTHADSTDCDWPLVRDERFAELVRADEREACAKVCEEYETNNDITATWLNIVAEAIRARSNT
jgi:hypothetical protein